MPLPYTPTTHVATHVSPRPLTARSVLASVLLGTDPPWLPTPLLVRTAALFGITRGQPPAPRSPAWSPPARPPPSDGGYRLAGRLVARQAPPGRQPPGRDPGVGRHVGAGHRRRPMRRARRPTGPRCATRSRALRLAELREGCWARPDNLDPTASPEAAAVVGRWCDRWRGAQPEAPTTGRRPLGPRRLGGRRRRAPRRDMAAPPAARSRTATPPRWPPASSTSAAVLRHLQADPLLPDALLPAAGRAPRSAPTTTATTPPTGPPSPPGSAPRPDPLRPPTASVPVPARAAARTTPRPPPQNVTAWPSRPPTVLGRSIGTTPSQPPQNPPARRRHRSRRPPFSGGHAGSRPHDRPEPDLLPLAAVVAGAGRAPRSRRRAGSGRGRSDSRCGGRGRAARWPSTWSSGTAGCPWA